jgi:NDP-sugar pyrophosphorylase family protein
MTSPVVVLTGGLGTRLIPITRDRLPKALVRVNNRPFIDYKLESLAEQGVRDVFLLVGHHGDSVIEHVGDGARYGLSIHSIADGPMLLGTGGAICNALDELPQYFWVTYGDSLVEVDLEKAEAAFHEEARLGLMTVLYNADRWAPSNVVIRDGFVVAYGKEPHPVGADFIDYGMLLLARECFSGAPQGTRFDLAEVLRSLAQRLQLVAFEVTTRFHEIGTPASLADVTTFVTERHEG